MSFALGVVITLYIVVLLCRYSWYLGWKACAKAMGVASEEFSEKYKHLDKYL